MHSVLMIAYFFPPLGGVGCQRAVKFARYLPQCGWHPLILTVNKSPYSLRDPDLMNELVAGTAIFRATTLEPEHLYGLYRRVLSWRRSGDHAPKNSGPQKMSLAARLQSWLFIPDGRIGWLPFALSLGRRVIQQEEPAAIFSTSAPYTAHLVARILARWSGLPWVMDLRDPWVDNHFNAFPTGFHRYLNLRLERKCVLGADKVVCVTPLMTEDMCRRYDEQPEEKFVTITNGFDSADFDPELHPDSRRFLIRHVGSLYAGQSALPFLRGLVLALQRDATLAQVLKVEFVGVMDRRNRRDWEAFVAAHRLQPWVSCHPFVSHRQALKLMQQTQVQLLILGEGYRIDRIYPAKLFEYLGAQQPILAVVSPGVAAALVQELDAGIVAESDDPSSVAEAILEFYSWFRQGKLQGWTTRGIEAYERRHLAGRLASVLNAVVAGK